MSVRERGGGHSPVQCSWGGACPRSRADQRRCCPLPPTFPPERTVLASPRSQLPPSEFFRDSTESNSRLKYEKCANLSMSYILLYSDIVK